MCLLVMWKSCLPFDLSNKQSFETLSHWWLRSDCVCFIHSILAPLHCRRVRVSCYFRSLTSSYVWSFWPLCNKLQSSIPTGTILVHSESSSDTGQRWRQALRQGMIKTQLNEHIWLNISYAFHSWRLRLNLIT